MRRAYRPQVHYPGYPTAFGLYDVWRPVAARLLVILVRLDDLSVLDTAPEGVVDGGRIARPAISRNLRLGVPRDIGTLRHDDPRRQVIDERPRNLFIPLAQCVAGATPDRVLGLHARFLFLPDRRFELEYREYRGEADAVAQTYEMTFAMPRPESVNILPGMTATLELELTAEAGSGQRIDIPTSALVTGADKGFIVWIYDPQSHLVEKRSVKVGPAAGRGVSVVAGLRGGELVVATGASQLQQGMKIQVLGEPVTDL